MLAAEDPAVLRGQLDAVLVVQRKGSSSMRLKAAHRLTAIEEAMNRCQSESDAKEILEFHRLYAEQDDAWVGVPADGHSTFSILSRRFELERFAARIAVDKAPLGMPTYWQRARCQ